MSIARELRIETLGAMKALRDMPSTSTVDRQMKETIIPAVIRLIEDCNAIETQRDELLAALKEATELLVEYVAEVGGCDHSVGICYCGDHSTLAKAHAAIAKVEAAA